MSASANILPELPRRQLGLEHLVDFFKRPVLNLRKVKVDPSDGKEARWRPNVAVLRPPVQCIGIDEIRGCESGEPSACESNRGCYTEGVGSKALRGDFASGEPGV